MPSVKVGTKSANNAIIGTVTKLKQGLKDLQTKHARMDMSIAIFTEARSKLQSTLAGTDATSLAKQAEFISSEPVDSLNPEMYKVTKPEIKTQIEAISEEYRNAFKEEITLKNFANIAWYEAPNLVGGNVRNKNFMTKDTNFKFQADNEPNVLQLVGANARALNVLSALMKSNRVKDDGTEDFVAPFDTATDTGARQIKPEHVGLRVNATVGSNNDINVLNNAFRSDGYSADLAAAAAAAAATNYNFELARDITNGVAKDNHYYLNNAAVNNTAPAGAVNHYANKMVRPAIKDNEPLFKIASEINTLIKAEPKFNEEFKNKLMDILIVLRNIINGTVADASGTPNVTSNVVYNVCALIGAIIGAAHTDGAIQVLNVDGAVGNAGNAITIVGGTAADSIGFANALTSIEEALGATNIKKAGAEFLRIIGVHKASMEAADGAGDLDNLKKFVTLAITYVIKATMAAASATGDDATEANAVATAIHTVVSGIPATLGDAGVGGLGAITAALLSTAGVVADEANWAAAALFNTATTANTAKDAGKATVPVQDISTHATTLITALRIKLDSRMTFLKDVIRKIKLPLYTIGDMTDGKITSIGVDGGEYNENLRDYVTYLFNKMASKDSTAFTALPDDVKTASPFKHDAFTNALITTAIGTAGRTEDQYNALQTFLKTYAYYPSILFSSYDPATNVIGDINTQDVNIHPSIYNSSLFIQIVTSPDATTEAYMKLTSKISELDQEKTRVDLKIVAIEEKLRIVTAAKNAAVLAKNAAIAEKAVYKGFTNKLSSDFEALYGNANMKQYMTNWDNGHGHGAFQRITYTGGRKYVGGYVSNVQFETFLNSIKSPNIKTNGNVANKVANIEEKLLPFYKSIAVMNVTNEQRSKFNSKMKNIMGPVSTELALELKNKNEVKIQEKANEITKKVQKLAQSKKIEELRALLDPSTTVNGVNKSNTRAYQAALNIVLNQLNLENANLRNLKASVNSKKAELEGKLKEKNKEYNMYNTSFLNMNISVQKPAAVQEVVTAAKNAASTAKTAVNLVEGEIPVSNEVKEKVNAANKAANLAQQGVNPVENTANAIAKAKEALRGLIKDLSNNNLISNKFNKNENLISNKFNKNEIITLLKQIKANITNEEIKTVQNVKKILGNNVSGAREQNQGNQGNLGSMFTGRETSENVTKINHGKGLRNALNSYTNGSNTSAIKTAYNEFMEKTNVNKNSVSNKNNLISRANVILNPKTNASIVEEQQQVNATNATNNSKKLRNLISNSKSNPNSNLVELITENKRYSKNAPNSNAKRQLLEETEIKRRLAENKFENKSISSNIKSSTIGDRITSESVATLRFKKPGSNKKESVNIRPNIVAQNNPSSSLNQMTQSPLRINLAANKKKNNTIK